MSAATPGLVFGWLIGCYSLGRLTHKIIIAFRAALRWRFLTGLFFLPLSDGQAPFFLCLPFKYYCSSSFPCWYFAHSRCSPGGNLISLQQLNLSPCTLAMPCSISGSPFLTGHWTPSLDAHLHFHLIPHSTLAILLNSAFPSHLVSPNINLVTILPFFLKKIIYLLSATLGLCCCTWTFSSCVRKSSPPLPCGGYSPLWHSGFSLQWPLLLWNTGSWFSGFSSVACLLSGSAACRIFPGPGIEPMSLSLAGWFLTTGPPGKLWSPFLTLPCGSLFPFNWWPSPADFYLLNISLKKIFVGYLSTLDTKLGSRAVFLNFVTIDILGSDNSLLWRTSHAFYEI